eukprot:4104088-Prymnesium_polylepis.1
MRCLRAELAALHAQLAAAATLRLRLLQRSHVSLWARALEAARAQCVATGERLAKRHALRSLAAAA